MNVDIIGAGIGGLTTALAFEQKGIKTRVFEQAEKIQPIGAGIILANNAMQVYEKLGLRRVIENNGNHISSMHITEANLNPISKIDLTFFEEKYNVKNIAIHRGTLQQILIDALKYTNLNLNHHLSKIKSNKNGYCLTFRNGEHIQSSTVIAADGLKSIVRKSLFPNNKIRSAKQVCWRGVTDYQLPIKYRNELNEAWGKSDRFGFVQIADHKVYWYALKSFKKHKNEFQTDHIDSFFNNYSSTIRVLIASTKKKHINTSEILDLKPTNNWYKEHVCLLGDAAHAMTPNMGQGACQAIEDAYVLSECLSNYEINKAFAIFQKLRLPKVHHVVKASRMLGKIAHIPNPMLIAFRNQMMRMTPQSFNRKQSEHIFQITNL